MKTFKEYMNEGFVNEGKVAFKNMKFTVTTLIDRQGLAIQFIPDSKTLDFSKNEQVDEIMNQLKRIMPKLAESLWFESGHSAAGVVFRLDTFKFTDFLTKEINRYN